MAAYQELTIEQGTDWDDEILVTDDETGDPIDLTGYTARSDIKRGPDDAALIEMSTDNGRITINAATGSIQRQLTAAITGALTWSRAQHDLILISAGGVVTRLCEGPVTVLARITE